MFKYALSDRFASNGQVRGISCDKEGIFLAGDIPLVCRSSDVNGRPAYKARPATEIEALLASAYGLKHDFTTRIARLDAIARYMNEDKWVLAKIATVHLRLPDVADDIALANLFRIEARSVLKRFSGARTRKSKWLFERAAKRDVSGEPRIPAGQSGGGEWTTEDEPATPTSNPLLIPAQAITAPIPWPLELPLPPTDITPFPLEIPGDIKEPTPVNPYPDRPECADEWAHALEFCRDLQDRGKLKPGYSGFGKDFASCVLGMVSEACGGNPTA